MRDEFIVLLGVNCQSSCVEQLVDKGVLVQGFVLEKCRMQSDGNWTGIESEFSLSLIHI